MQVSRRWDEDFIVHDLLIPKYNHNTLDTPLISHERKIICYSICLNITTHIPIIWYEQENECIIIKINFGKMKDSLHLLHIVTISN